MALMINKDNTPRALSDEENAYQIIQRFIKAKKFDLAIIALEKLIEAYPDFAVGHNDLAVLYYNQGQKEKSLNHHEKSAELNPDNITFQKNLADFYQIEQGRLGDAMVIYLKILTANPEDVETLLAIGNISLRIGHTDEAKGFFNRVLEIEPWNSKAWQTIQALK
jgi:tetratricopeptide (TPR) repeat protein